jgi:hypothetical protein
MVLPTSGFPSGIAGRQPAHEAPQWVVVRKRREDGIGFKTLERLGRGLKLSAWVSGLELGGGHGRGRNRVLVLRANPSRPSSANEQDSSLSRVPLCRGTSERLRGHPLRGRLGPTVLRDATEARRVTRI